jgi:hypothetical protein
MFIQQGDVLIKEVKSSIDFSKAKKVERKQRGWVLAEGETTGHAHVIDDDIELMEIDGTLYMKNAHDVVIEHEEHNAHTIPAGVWEIGIVQEYDHFAEEARKVRD